MVMLILQNIDRIVDGMKLNVIMIPAILSEPWQLYGVARGSIRGRDGPSINVPAYLVCACMRASLVWVNLVDLLTSHATYSRLQRSARHLYCHLHYSQCKRQEFGRVHFT
jgi:hypothetical protein